MRLRLFWPHYWSTYFTNLLKYNYVSFQNRWLGYLTSAITDAISSSLCAKVLHRRSCSGTLYWKSPNRVQLYWAILSTAGRQAFCWCWLCCYVSKLNTSIYFYGGVYTFFVCDLVVAVPIRQKKIKKYIINLIYYCSWIYLRVYHNYVRLV